ncbi:hypothetical protein SAY86_029669 [Trapa natans]|uniref:Polymerase nucleotidyl transferase domain-containing protein n=1 Tax=Trapa natans TaxID=22666 RepID=A0AAN7RHK6_TRANT|nr:hypothetical protein SAY86_029669 [Trapa natans]
MGDLWDRLSEATVAGLDRTSPPSLRPERRTENLQIAEEVAQGIIARIHPNSVSYQRRRNVIDYVKRLLKNYIGCEVFPFGSVPLMTYLPDGDIDLTAFSCVKTETLCKDVFTVLSRENWNRNSEFVVKDVQLIPAEVKLVKCLIQNIVVDISFNQLGGLCTLCFLGQVDLLIGKDHLLKRSILLIKAWCYYESRILGAHHGLLSTYALETLVLYIFHLYHRSLNGPLAVFCKFLDYYSKFDWEKYCVSLSGPVLISSLPELVVEPPDISSGDLLFSNDFLKECREAFSVPTKGFGTTTQRTFTRKHLNIIDPLKENNNLGRSVSRGNYFRIRSAFGFGVQKLERVLSGSKGGITSILNEMFSNTMDRHVDGQRPDVQGHILMHGQDDFGNAALFSGHEPYQENQSSYQTNSAVSSVTHISPMISAFDKVIISEEEKPFGKIESEMPQISEVAVSEEDYYADESSSSTQIFGDLDELATARNFSTSNGSLKSLPSDALYCIVTSVRKARLGAHLCFSHSPTELNENRNGDATGEPPEKPGLIDTFSSVCQNSDGEQSTSGLHERPFLSSPISWSSEDTYHAYPSHQTSSLILEPSNSLLDLSGDYRSHIRSLQHGQWCYNYALAAQVPQDFPPFTSELQGKSPWDVVRKSVKHSYGASSRINSNGLVSGQLLYPANQVIQIPPFGVEERPKTRGTGTYFPNPNMNQYRARIQMGEGRLQTLPVKSPHDNGRGSTFVKLVLPERIKRLLEADGRPSMVPTDLDVPDSPERKSCPSANGSMHQPPSDQVPEFGLFRQSSSLGGSSQPQSSNTNPSTSRTQEA